MEKWRFLHELGIYKKQNPGYRKGQAMFNLACDFFAGKFQEPPFEHSGDLDPFYVDDHCEIFLQHLISTGCLVE